MSAADEGRSLGELVASATADLSALVHDEIALAKAEVRQDIKRAAFGSTATAIAVALGLFAVPMFSFALAYWLWSWWNISLALAFTIVGGLYVLLAVVLTLLAKGWFSRISPPTKSLESTKESAAVLSGVRPHPRPAATSPDNRAEGSDTAPSGTAPSDTEGSDTAPSGTRALRPAVR